VTDQIKKTLGVVLVLVLGVGLWVLYSSMQPTVTRLQDHDPQALEALDLVKHHLSREGYTLEQELQLFVDELKVKGVPHREEEWQVAAQKDKYVVRKIVREKGSVEWIEREFAWRVDVKEKSIDSCDFLSGTTVHAFRKFAPTPASRRNFVLAY
jgi:hypothetical protein